MILIQDMYMVGQHFDQIIKPVQLQYMYTNIKIILKRLIN